MFHLIASVSLVFTHYLVLFFIGLFISFIIRPAFLFQTACLISIDIIINCVLKGYFKVPLSPTLHKIGYAFPSGHMQMAAVFYLWCAYFLPSLAYKLLLVMILLGVGIGLIHYGYHNIYDVIAGLFFGALIVWAYHACLSKDNKFFPWQFLIFSSLLMLWNATLYHQSPLYACTAYICLVLLIVIERTITKNGKVANDIVSF